MAAKKAKTSVLNENKLYNDLMGAWIKVHGSTKETQEAYNKFWNSNGKGETEAQKEIINNKIRELKSVIEREKSRFMTMLLQPKKASSSSTSSSAPMANTQMDQSGGESQTFEQVVGRLDESPQSQPIVLDESEQDPAPDPSTVVEEPRRKKPSPTQETLLKSLKILETRISSTTHLKMQLAATTEQLEQLKKDLKERIQVQKQLEDVVSAARRQRKHRQGKKAAWSNLKIQEPGTYEKVSTALKKREKVGRPSLEVTQPGLVSAILDVVSHECSADEFRQSDQLNSHMNLDSLHKKVEAKGYELSRQALYYRLLPRRSNSKQGSRHVTTVPVRIIRPQNDKRKQHDDAHFCAAFIKYLKDLCELMGGDTVFAISQDDKAKVPMGIAAAKLQAPIVMHLDYRVSLSDHDFPVANDHKLIPSVYAVLTFNKDGKLGYSGPTYVVIRSMKHDSSTAKSHGRDFNDLLKQEEFKTFCHTGAGEVKPIVIIFTDGGPDENPRFEGPFYEAAQHFKNHNLDAIFLATHAPGHSAYNQVERRMAPLSRDLAGVVLPYEHYGNHLKMPGRTPEQKEARLEVERKNFQKAGECLAEIWTGKLIDSYQVVAKYAPPTTSSSSSKKLRGESSITGASSPTFITPEWKGSHVRQTQYSLQIMKCDDRSCCSEPRTNLKKILGGFIPAPVPFKKTELGVIACPRDDTEGGHYGSLSTRLMLKGLDPGIENLQFDYYCPTLKNVLERRVCPHCSEYFTTIGASKAHEGYCKPKNSTAILTSSVLAPEISDDEQVELIQLEDESNLQQEEVELEEQPMEIVEDLGSWYGVVFEELDVNEAVAESQIMQL